MGSVLPRGVLPPTPKARAEEQQADHRYYGFAFQINTEFHTKVSKAPSQNQIVRCRQRRMCVAPCISSRSDWMSASTIS